jgi:hypothetical protein
MHVGVWGLAAIVVVVVSWLMYRYLAPKSWKEWTRAGVLQAFIIAFYAEMYGFPLTIYFLARYFGLDLAWTAGGNLWAQLLGTPIAIATLQSRNVRTGDLGSRTDYAQCGKSHAPAENPAPRGAAPTNIRTIPCISWHRSNGTVPA